MCLNTDPALTAQLLKAGHFSEEQAKREIKNLEAEISSDVYTLEQAGLKSMQELNNLINYCNKEPSY